MSMLSTCHIPCTFGISLPSWLTIILRLKISLESWRDWVSWSPPAPSTSVSSRVLQVQKQKSAGLRIPHTKQIQHHFRSVYQLEHAKVLLGVLNCTLGVDGSLGELEGLQEKVIHTVMVHYTARIQSAEEKETNLNVSRGLPPVELYRPPNFSRRNVRRHMQNITNHQESSPDAWSPGCSLRHAASTWLTLV